VLDELLYFILSSYGMTMVLAYGRIFNKVRPKNSFFHCPMCLGFWVGVLLWAFSPFTSLFMFDRGFVTAFLLGCLSSGTSYFLSQIVGDWGIRHEHVEPEVDVTTSS